VLSVLVLSSALQETLYTLYAQNEFYVSLVTSMLLADFPLCLILDESDSSDCVFTKTTFSCYCIFISGKASFCICISMWKCQASFHHFGQSAIFQIAHCISLAQHMAPHLVNSWMHFTRIAFSFWWSTVQCQHLPLIHCF